MGLGGTGGIPLWLLAFGLGISIWQRFTGVEYTAGRIMTVFVAQIFARPLFSVT